MMGSTVPTAAGAEALALLTAAADPEGTRARVQELTEAAAAYQSVLNEARAAETAARQEREVAEALKREIGEQQAELAALDRRLTEAGEAMNAREADLADREQAFSAEYIRRLGDLSDRADALFARENEVARREAAADRQQEAADALRAEWSEKVGKIREFLASLG